MTIIGFVLSPVGRWLVGGLTVVSLLGGIYLKGRSDGKATYKAKIEREIATAIRDGKDAKRDALREFDRSPDRVPDDGFSRP